jgi:hypothetical protein
LVPDNQIHFAGNASNRTVRLVPARNQSGTAIITLTVIDEQGGVASRTFGLTVNAVNQPPSLSPIPDQVTDETGHTGQIPIFVRDTETPSSALVLSGVSSNPTLIPNDQIQITGAGMNRVVTVTRAGQQTGTARITITVTDGGGASASSSFEVTVSSQNRLPVISPIADQVTDEDTPTAPVGFIIGDIETPATNLVVTAQSSNPVLVPQSGLILGGSGSNRNVTITPAAGRFGAAIIVLTVTDAEGAHASNSFTLTVIQTNFPLVITTQPQNQTVTVGTTVTLTVIATGDAPFAYQWQREGVDLLRQTNSTFVLTNIQPDQAGNYNVVVSNPRGSVSSDSALVRVLVRTTIAPLIRTNGIAVILFTSVAGLQYTIEYKNTLDDPGWTVLDVRAGTGGPMEFRDTEAKVPTRFYRVRIE